MIDLKHVPRPLRDRVEWLDAEIRAGRYPNYEKLCARFQCCSRTAAATVTFLRDRWERLHYSRSAGGYFYGGEPPPPITRDGIGLSRAEFRALRLALALGRRYLDAGTVGDLSAIHDRLLEYAASPDLKREAAVWREQVVFTGPAPLPAPRLDQLHAAISERAVLRIDYRAPGRRDLLERRVEPHFLVNAIGDWLLVGWDKKRQAPRTFAVARIAWLESTGETFEPRSDLRAEEFTRYQFLSEGGRAPYTLVLRFSPALAQVAAERKWHPTQSPVRPLDGGGCELRMSVAGESDVLRWILGFGAGVEVIEPEWMRRLVADAAHAMATTYSGELLPEESALIRME